MKEFHVYGLGNALVDFEFEVSNETLTRLKIKKGVMTLVDELSQQQLLTQLDGQKHAKASGGSAANSMIALAQLGGKGFHSCKLAQDTTGDFYLQDLLRHGITTNMTSHNRESGTSGKCIVMLTPDYERTMHTFLGISETLSSADLDPLAISHSEFLYIEGYLASSKTARAAAIAAREIAEKNQVKTAISLSDPNIVAHFKEHLQHMIGNQVDLLFCNELEAYLLANTKNLAHACKYLKQIAKTFVITLGANGSLIFDGLQMMKIPAVLVNAIDTLGAGDMYAGTFLYGITHNHSYAHAGRLASQAAGKIVSHYGPRLPKLSLDSLTYEVSNVN